MYDIVEYLTNGHQLSLINKNEFPYKSYDDFIFIRYKDKIS